MNPTQLVTVERQTVQSLPDVKADNGASAASFWSDAVVRGELLPGWGTVEASRWLRAYDRNDYNTLWQGAAAGLIKKFSQAEFQLSGGRNLTHRFDDVLRYASFGQGSQRLRQLLARDYLRFDHGAFMEIIAPGNPMKAPTGQVTGLAHLDAFACLPTGDPEYPVIYTNTNGKQHILHHTRVVQFVDMPDGDQTNPGYGMCALRRSVAVIQRQILMGRYIVTSLDDKPPPGMLLVGGMAKAQWDAAWTNYRREQSTDERPAWGKVIPIFGADAALTPTITSVSFSTPPEKFDYKVYVELDVHEFALAIGVDVQELWELTSGNLGSAGQSQIQHVKSQGKTLGEMLGQFERAMNNHVLPDSLEFEFKVRDPYEAQERAQNAQVWAGFLSSAGSALTNDEKRQILANMVEAVADAIIDADGNLIRLPDADAVAPGQELQVTAEDGTPLSAGTMPAPSPAPGQALQLQLVKGAKDIQATRLEFEADAAALFDSAQADEVNRRRFGIILRDLIRKYGDKAFRDGLEAGGVTEDMSAEDRTAYTTLLATQSAYVSSLGDALYHDGAGVGDSATKASMWFNKSISPFYEAGRLSADANGMYEWVLGDAEHCTSCLAMSGQKHRLKDYVNKGITPKASVLECGGFLCACSLVKTTGRAKGGWLG